MSVTLLEVNENVLKQVAESYDKTEKQLLGEVTELKEWMRQQPHLPEVMDDHALQNIYIGNKCRMEKTQQKLDMYYTMRSQKVHMFKNGNPKLPNMRFVMEALYCTVLPKMTVDMYRVFVYKARDKDLANAVDPYSFACHLINVQEIRIHEDIAFGDVFIFDMEGISLRYLFKFTPMVIYNFVKAHERYFSSRLKALYLVNAPFYVAKLLTFTKIFMKPKLFDRIHCYTDASVVSTEFPKNILPKDYGGEEKSLQELNEILASKFEEYQERFDRLDQLRVNEKLRPKKQH